MFLGPSQGPQTSNANWVGTGGDYGSKGRMHDQIQFYKTLWKNRSLPWGTSLQWLVYIIFCGGGIHGFESRVFIEQAKKWPTFLLQCAYWVDPHKLWSLWNPGPWALGGIFCTLLLSPVKRRLYIRTACFILQIQQTHKSKMLLHANTSWPTVALTWGITLTGLCTHLSHYPHWA